MARKVDSTESLLRRVREERGQSLRDAAVELGVAASHLSRLERGEKVASPELRERAASYYGISDDLLALEAGRIPADISLILMRNPGLIAELRDRFGGHRGT